MAEPDNIVLKQLALLRDEMRDGFGKMERRFTVLEGKIDGLAGTLVGVQRDVRRLSDNVSTLGAAIDDHSRRLDHIEQRLGIERPICSRLPSGKSQNPPHHLDRDALENLVGDFLGAASRIGVVDDALHHHARILDNPCAAAPSGDALGVGASAPVDHRGTVIPRYDASIAVDRAGLAPIGGFWLTAAPVRATWSA